MSDTTLNGGSVRILWDASTSAVVNITGSGNVSFTVNGSAVTFPYTLNSSTTFDTIQTGDYTVSVQHNGIEVAETPDGTKNVRLSGGGQVIFNPTVDAGGRGKNLLDELSATYASKGIPTYAGIRTGSFDPVRSLYNSSPINLRKTRAKLGASRQGSVCRLAFAGDSEMRGYGTTFQKSWPIQLQALLAGAGSALQGSFIPAAVGGTTDSRVTFAGGGSDGTGMTRTVPNAGTATFVTDTACTSLMIVFQDNGNPFTLTVDGAAPAGANVTISGTGTYSTGTVTPGNSATYKTATISSLSNATHTLVITGMTGTFSTWVQGVLPTVATPGLIVCNGGATSSKASGWKNTGTNYFQQVLAALGGNPDLTIFSLGVNDYQPSISATYKADYTAAINLATATGSDVLLVVEPHASVITQANWEQAVSIQYDIADSLGLPLLDLYHRWGTYSTANGLGIMFDTIHPNATGYSDVARAVYNVLTT